MPQIRIIALDQNSGFARGNNIGIRQAGGRYLALLNNDTALEPDYLAELARVSRGGSGRRLGRPQDPELFRPDVIDSVGGLVLCGDGIGQGRGRGERDRGQYDTARPLLPSGCAPFTGGRCSTRSDCSTRNFSSTAKTPIWVCAPFGPVGRPPTHPGRSCITNTSTTSSAYSPQKMRLVERNHYFLALKNFPPGLLLALPFLEPPALRAHGLGGPDRPGQGRCGGRRPNRTAAPGLSPGPGGGAARRPASMEQRPCLRASAPGRSPPP